MLQFYGQTEGLDWIYLVYIFCEKGLDNKIGVTGYLFLREVAVNIECDKKYKHESKESD